MTPSATQIGAQDGPRRTTYLFTQRAGRTAKQGVKTRT